jgi:hypothetical protein
MNVIMDQSCEHDGIYFGGEAGDGLPLARIPTERGRSVTYLEGLSVMVVTGYTLVACCHQVGSFLIDLRRKHGWPLATNGSWKTMWKLLKLGDRAAIENLCSLEKKLDRYEDLATVQWLLDRVAVKHQKVARGKGSNCILMPLLDYGKKVPTFA